VGFRLMLVRGFLLCLAGWILLQVAIRAGRRAALFTGTFWLTFPEYARYRIRRLWPVGLGLAGLILLIWGLIFLFQWLLAYYQARLGHPLS
jgi:hypothetical protein